VDLILDLIVYAGLACQCLPESDTVACWSVASVAKRKRFMTLNTRLELKIKELESKLELEQTTRGRMETQVTGGLYYKHIVTVNDTSRVISK
jgi:hypothetical protein